MAGEAKMTLDELEALLEKSGWQEISLYAVKLLPVLVATHPELPFFPERVLFTKVRTHTKLFLSATSNWDIRYAFRLAEPVASKASMSLEAFRVAEDYRSAELITRIGLESHELLEALNTFFDEFENLGPSGLTRYLPPGFKDAAQALGYSFFQTKPRKNDPETPFTWAGWSMRIPHPSDETVKPAVVQLWFKTSPTGLDFERWGNRLRARKSRHLAISVSGVAANWSSRTVRVVFAGRGAVVGANCRLEDLPRVLEEKAPIFFAPRGADLDDEAPEEESEPERHVENDLAPRADHPSLVPKLKFSIIAKRLVEQIAETADAGEGDLARRTVTVGLFGPWGAGKSTMIQALKNTFDTASKAEAGVRYQAIDINAWRIPAGRNLHDHVLSVVMKELGPELIRRKEGCAKIYAKFFDWCIKNGPAVAFWGFVLLSFFLLLYSLLKLAIIVGGDLISMFSFGLETEVANAADPESATDPVAPAKPAPTTGVTPLIAGLASLIGTVVVQKSQTGLRGFFEDLFRRSTAHVDPQDRLEKAYADIAEAGVSADKTLVFFIDDLDRCPPERVGDFMESVHSLTTAGCVTILACDEAYIAAALNARYADVVQSHPDGDRFGHSFMEKIVQIGLHVPSLERVMLADLDIKVPVPDGVGVGDRQDGAVGTATDADADADRGEGIKVSAGAEKDLPFEVEELLPQGPPIPISETVGEIIGRHVEALGLTPRTVVAVSNTIRLYLNIALDLGFLDSRDAVGARRLAAFIFADRIDRQWLDAYRIGGEEPERYAERARQAPLFAHKSVRDDLEKRMVEGGEALAPLYRLTGRQPRALDVALTPAAS